MYGAQGRAEEGALNQATKQKRDNRQPVDISRRNARSVPPAELAGCPARSQREVPPRLVFLGDARDDDGQPRIALMPRGGGLPIIFRSIGAALAAKRRAEAGDHA